MKHQSIEDLPKGLQKRIRSLPVEDPAEWVRESVPALGDRSVLQVMNESDDGYAEVLRYLTKVEGYLM